MSQILEECPQDVPALGEAAPAAAKAVLQHLHHTNKACLHAAALHALPAPWLKACTAMRASVSCACAALRPMLN